MIILGSDRQGIKYMKKLHVIPFWEKHKNLVHGFSTKARGNMAFRSGERSITERNRREFFQDLKINMEDALILPLSHSNRVLSLPKKESLIKNQGSVYIGGGHIFSTSILPVYDNPEWQMGIDVVVTDKWDVFPIIMSADCAAVGFFDSRKEIVAFAHAGLIGAVNQIVPSVIRCMVEEYSSAVTDIEVVIFPSIRSCHYDLNLSGAWARIRDDVITHFGKDDPIFDNGRFDLQSLLCRQMLEEGILETNIYDVNLCTVCNREMFFSNLAAGSPDAKKSEGRFISILGVKNEKYKGD